ncbi:MULTISPECIES: N-acetylglucosamine kinase [unclassified Mesorhizobium]|uniref:N-acetylglucosamine kinase n=1 Tax=unclassified Mesorhizobium TaxID=325217 RepID=UPI000FCA26E4|nr:MULTISPECIES: N-acetylglucosamine kinase [unclassified Mesorhizobium]MDF3152480.1 N-acetylglucosamine kinase [Mesorhizobium sp. XAP10]MDF3245510.1 N-acetylglucosamine kinase [Mesorhizobium sp. XAP4]RUX75843.1 N-acetylglucosamine kinase [Mesorhizobium sp. M7A.F.Ca.US.005.03.1.1]RUY14824.1 N-acetylglucosamine kinase [Mesorhizobium sp. M7A.F.Ca.US.005.03.2.1]RUY42977.1 N-acetylglucosamine kinase [Mesorhizobium sp. M7A.F.Ca.US.001.04.1.1]
MNFVLGIDGGGTSCRAALATADGTVIGRAKSGAANIRTDLTGARSNIVEAARQAFLVAGQDPELIPRTPAILGLAGANVGTYRQQLEAILPFSISQVETDAEIALEGAVGAGDGAMAILGTGTAYMARRQGKSRAIGGWGFQVGDQGSGARIGRDLLEQTLLAYDGVRAGSPLTQSMLAVFRNNPEDVVEFTTNAKPGDFGGFAPKVFEHAEKGDSVANWILDKVVADVEASLGALDLADDAPLCLLGGLAPLYAPRLSARYRALLKPPLDDALGGAVQMAVRLLAGHAEATR